MKKPWLILIFLFSTLVSHAQFTKEKLENILTGPAEKSWNVSNPEMKEKSFSFNKNYSVTIQNNDGIKKTEKWSLKSPDEIRWNLTVGTKIYELIISYDKNGEQYLKLNLQAGKGLSEFEIKLVPAK